ARECSVPLQLGGYRIAAMKSNNIARLIQSDKLPVTGSLDPHDETAAGLGRFRGTTAIHFISIFVWLRPIEEMNRPNYQSGLRAWQWPRSARELPPVWQDASGSRPGVRGDDPRAGRRRSARWPAVSEKCNRCRAVRELDRTRHVRAFPGR